MRRSLAALLLAGSLATAVAAGCGGDDEGDNAGERPATGPGVTSTERAPSEAPVATVSVEETEFEIDPKDARVEETGVIRIDVENAGEALHALDVETPAGEASTGDIQPGESGTVLVRIDEPGEYTWYCPVGNHREQGMEGTLTVAGGGASSGGSSDADEEAKRQSGDSEAGGGGDGATTQEGPDQKAEDSGGAEAPTTEEQGAETSRGGY